MSFIRINQLTKIFPGTVALDNVNIEFEKGEIHCIVGENGAGKSTLIKCLKGVLRQERGEIIIDGKSVHDSEELSERIALVPQEIEIFPNMSIAENLFIPFGKTGINGGMSIRKMASIAEDTLSKFGIECDASQPAKELSIAEQQLLLIARATVQQKFDAIIFDEPTTSLSQQDIDRLFNIIFALKERQIAVIFISHKLEEVFRVGDKVTVIRDGEIVANSLIKDIDEQWIVRNMTGKELKSDENFRSSMVSREKLLSVKELTGVGFTEATFDLHKGEIIGFAGLVGAGRTELVSAIYGLEPVFSGQIKIGDTITNRPSVPESVGHGMVFLSEDRKNMGILPLMDICKNLTILSIRDYVKANIIDNSKEKEAANSLVDKYNIKIANLEQEIQSLSGGNQQKAIIARSMLSNPNIAIFDEPTKGVDVGAKYEIYDTIKHLAESGLGIILVSSELNELQKCCNRIFVMYQGAIVAEYLPDTNAEIIMNSMIGR